MVDKKTTVLCPVCELYNFSSQGTYDICPICDWENDEVQMDNHDYGGGANELSVNEFKVLYQLRNMNEKADALRVIIDHHESIRKSIFQKNQHADGRIIDGEKLSNELQKEHERYFEELLFLRNQ
jgi:hypothetical protein